jgi:rSAM/selenodomain-associated transferase 1
MSDHRSLLIVFYRNPEQGKVKTRLAATVGDGPALRIYEALCDHTLAITRELSFDRAVFYSETIDSNDRWSADRYLKYVQAGDKLGQRMSNAFQLGFQSGYTAICIIGTDCYELTSDIIADAFARLEHFDAVIGPAKDGGYYLLGLKAFYPALFIDKQWGTNTVFDATCKDFEEMGISWHQLAVLRDVDNASDLPPDLKSIID